MGPLWMIAGSMAPDQLIEWVLCEGGHLSWFPCGAPRQSARPDGVCGEDLYPGPTSAVCHNRVITLGDYPAVISAMLLQRAEPAEILRMVRDLGAFK